MTQLWDRRDPRVGFRAVVRLCGPDQQEPVYAHAGNLSQTGLLVDSHRTYDIGSEVVCDLPLPDDHLTLRGRVAWVRTEEPVLPAGRPRAERQGRMGIEFVETPNPDALLQVVGEVGEVAPGVEKVNAWFEGADQPVRVEAVHTDDGLRLRTAIPFFRINSSVAFAVPGDAGDVVVRQGKLRQVELVVSPERPVPCLELEVESDPVLLDEQTCTSHVEPVERVVDAATVRCTALIEPTEALSVDREAFSAPPPPTSETEPTGVAGYLRSDHGEALSRAPAHLEEDDELQIDFEVPTRLSDTLNMGIGHEPLPLDQPDALSAELSGRPNADGQSYPLVIRPEPDDEDLDTGEIDPDFWANTTPQPWRRWIWVAALAMAGLAIASVVQTRLWERVGSAFVGSDGPQAKGAKTTPLKPEAPPVVVVEPEEARAKATPAKTPATPPTPAVAAKEPADEPATPGHTPKVSQGDSVKVPKPSPTTTAPKPAPEPKPVRAAATAPIKPFASRTTPERRPAVAGKWSPRLKRVGPATVLTIPIRGSLEGLKRYPLGNPDGFVVKLPNARPRVPFGDYRVHDGGFRVVWVREHEQGVQLRFLFSKPTPQHQVDVTDSRITVTLTPPEEPLTEEPDVEEPTDA